MKGYTLVDLFGLHPAETPEAQRAHERVRGLFLDVAVELDEMLPGGREKALMLTKLQEAAMWANAGLAMTRPVHHRPSSAPVPGEFAG